MTDLSFVTGLTNLNSLVLAGNPASNFTQLSGITGLTNLWLFDAGLNEAAFLTDWTWLNYLNLEGNLLTNLSPLAGLTNLTGLGLSRNPLTTYEALPGLTNLASLRLDGNRLTNLAFLSNLTQLTFLSLNTNHLTDLSALTGLTQLQALYLQRNWLREIEPLQQLPRLLDVDVSLNLLSLSTNSPGALTVATNLQLAGVRTTCLPINQPPSLSTLNQWHLARDATWSNAVLVLDDETPANQLVVTATSSSPELVSVLTSPLAGTNNDRTLTFAAHSQTEAAVLTLTVMDEAGLSTSTNVLVTVEPLTNVGVPDPQLEAAIRTRLNQPDRPLTTADLLALTDLHADSRAITNLSGLEGALNLTTLTLGGNTLTNLAPLEHLPQLGVLSLNQNRLTDVASLAGLTNLNYLSLRHNLLTNINLLPSQPPTAWLDLRLNLIDLDGAMQTLQRLTNLQVNVSYEPQREPPHLEPHGSWAIRANMTSRLPFIAWDNGQASAELAITVA
ncbi:MAG TPA: hypothetical protein VNT26_14030, partial [Candidatus Sulfotelmatobacter sp.]|nr:hypothetical protein [Candidatus Sulfotelmatobacter sp.]